MFPITLQCLHSFQFFCVLCTINMGTVKAISRYNVPHLFNILHLGMGKMLQCCIPNSMKMSQQMMSKILYQFLNSILIGEVQHLNIQSSSRQPVKFIKFYFCTNDLMHSPPKLEYGYRIWNMDRPKLEYG